MLGQHSTTLPLSHSQALESRIIKSCRNKERKRNHDFERMGERVAWEGFQEGKGGGESDVIII